MPLRLSQVVIATLLVCLLTYWTLTFDRPAPEANPIPARPITTANPGDEIPFYNFHTSGSVLGHHGIVNLTSSQVEVAQIHISALRDASFRPQLMQPLDVRIPKFSPYQMQDGASEIIKSSLPAPARTTARVTAPLTTPVDASNVIFGVATTYERLWESLDQFSHWAGGTNCKIVALLAPTVDGGLPERVLEKAKRLAVPLTVVESGMDFLDRYFSLLRVLHEHRQPSHKWLSFIDDDTFFPSLPTLLSTLSKYPTSSPWYIGALTEDFIQMAQWGFMAYGGGGVFLSLPLADQLIPHFNDCFAVRTTGDRMLAHCIYKHTSTKLTFEHGLHQMDLHGSHAGFYEALRPQPLSLHHWKSEDFDNHIDITNMSVIARVCGDACLLQKYRLGGKRSGWVLTNGFSLVRYSDADMHHRDLDSDISMERTWYFYGKTNDAHFEHSLAPLRPKDAGKISFQLESAIAEERSGSAGVGLRVRQLYVRRRPEDFSVLQAVEIIWEVVDS